MPKHRVLSFKPQLRLEWRGQDGQNETEQPDHSAGLGDSVTSSTRIRFSVHTVASAHLNKLARVSALELADGLTASDGRRADRTMGWALRMRAARGPHAVVEAADHPAMLASGLTEVDIREVQDTITLLRENSPSPVPRARILRMLADCGASQSEGDISEAQTIWYRGQAAALLAVDQRWSGYYKADDELIDHLVSDDVRNFAPPVPSIPAAAASRADIIERPLGEQGATVRNELSAPVSILELAERLIEEKAALKEWRRRLASRCDPSPSSLLR